MFESITPYFYLFLVCVVLFAVFHAARRQKTVLTDSQQMNDKSLTAMEDSMANQKTMIRLLEEQNALLQKIAEK